jgi:hypothetical protein
MRRTQQSTQVVIDGSHPHGTVSADQGFVVFNETESISVLESAVRGRCFGRICVPCIGNTKAQRAHGLSWDAAADTESDKVTADVSLANRKGPELWQFNLSIMDTPKASQGIPQ